jgi:hypothetical protein
MRIQNAVTVPTLPVGAGVGGAGGGEHPPLGNWASLPFVQAIAVEEWVPVVLVIIILMAWIVILGPSLLKRRARGGDQSITHFHQQLRILEHSAPEPLVAPAYRLRALDGSGTPTGVTYADSGRHPVLTVVGAKELPRPALAFLGEPAPSAASRDPKDDDDRDLPPAARFDDDPGGLAVPADREPWAPSASPLESDAGRRGPDALTRQQARRRRRDILCVLAGILVTSILFGAVTGSTALWVLCGLDAVALAAYVAVLVHLRRLAQERELKLHYLDPRRDGYSAAAGGPPSYVSGRYAHPSNWHAAAR